jgi:hypothetical protein
MEEKEILALAKQFFRDRIIESHKSNTLKLKDSSHFQINPFVVSYLGAFLEGEITPTSIAKALVYPRALGTSINTTFGTQMQNFIGTLKDSFGSMVSGFDVEYLDQTSGVKKYCQLKAGPNTINRDDVKSIHDHFLSALRLAKTNGLKVSKDDLVIGLLWGEEHQLSGHYKRLRDYHGYNILCGEEFWHKLTGVKDFYFQLIDVFNSIALEESFSSELEKIIEELSSSKEVIKIYERLSRT